MATKGKPDPPLPPERLCQATNGNKEGKHEKCQRTKGYGTPHPGWGRCKMHGGCTKSGVVAAVREELAARHRLFGELVDIDPGEGLLQEVARSNGFIRFIESCLEDKGIDAASLQDPSRLLLELSEEGWQVQAWVKMWQAERTHFVRTCKMALDAGIAERQIRIVEQFAEIIGDLVYGLIAELGLDPEDPEVRKVAHRQLMKVGQRVAGSSTPLILAPTLSGA